MIRPTYILLTVAAEHFGIPQQTLRSAIRNGRLKARKADEPTWAWGERIVWEIDAADLLDWIKDGGGRRKRGRRRLLSNQKG